ncbi:MAG: DUF3565 domain-containing protein [Actinobacteria bacterium]|nr:DUF3565 domain-containing protein [Actinomycetota bacterium]
MIREIVGFRQDEAGDWIADLACLHRQHIRHQPPFSERPWVLDPAARAARIGTGWDCPLCDRAELPEGLHLVRTAGPFDDVTLPPGLRATHHVAAARWGRLRLLDGAVGFSMDTDPPIVRHMVAGDEQPIPPEVPHRLTVDGPVRLVVEFFARDD